MASSHRSILVPTDGSEKDGRALAVAADLATLADAGIHLIRVVDPPAKKAKNVGPLAVLEGVYPSNDAVESELRTQAASLRSRVKRSVTMAVIEDAKVPEAILRAAGQQGAFAIVMATRAPTTLERLVQGSVGDRLVREADRPVVLVPPGADDMKGKRVQLRRILVPLDGSNVSRAAIDTLAALPGASELELVLMHVARRERTAGLPLPPMNAASAINDTPEFIHVQADQARVHLEEVAARLRAQGMRATISVVESTEPARSIIEAVREELVDAIAMTTRGAGGARRMAHGSVATTVVRESEVPVMLVRA